MASAGIRSRESQHVLPQLDRRPGADGSSAGPCRSRARGHSTRHVSGLERPVGAGRWPAAQPPGIPAAPAGQRAPLTPEYQAIFEASLEAAAAGGRAADPTDTLRSGRHAAAHDGGQPMEIVITPGADLFHVRAGSTRCAASTPTAAASPTEIDPSFDRLLDRANGRTAMAMDASTRWRSRPAPSRGRTPMMRAAFRSTRTIRRWSPRSSTRTKPIPTSCTTRSAPAIMR